MLLKGYRKEIFRPKCNPSFESLHCIAHLDQDIGEVIPYLNAALDGDAFTREPPSVTFKYHGKLITLHPREIAVNALREEAEADRILDWLREEINQTWENRANIAPKYEGKKRPQVFEIMKLLPRTNCRECGQSTCMVFAVQVTEGGKDPRDCPPLAEDKAVRLESYLSRFDRES